MNVVCSAVSYGLGPTGKLCSIINACQNINWYLCGDKIDEFVFKNNIFKKRLYTRNKIKIKKYVRENNIEVALVVLDGELATIYKEIGLTVIYVDSLPFMWQESDVINGDVPLNVDYYCAQKSYSKQNSKILDKAYNLININPILPIMKYKKIKEKYDVIINLGGLSIEGNISTAYIDSILPSILNYVKNNNYTALITCGSHAKEYIISEYEINNITIKSMEHEEFLNVINSNERIITTAGLTTILEISRLNKKVILLPPNNLSQYYNQEIAKDILNKYKIITWDNKELSFQFLKEKLKYGEEEVVKLIQRSIEKNVGKINFKEDFKDDNYITSNKNKDIILNGTLEIKKILDNILFRENNSIGRFLQHRKYINKEYYYVPYIGTYNFSKHLKRLKKSRDYMIKDILKIDEDKKCDFVEYNLGHGNPAMVKINNDTLMELNEFLNTNSLSIYNSALGSKKEKILDFIKEQQIYYDNDSEIHLNNIIPTNSVTHAFNLVLKAICRKHDVVLFTAPCYGLFAYMPERVGAETRFIELKEEDDFIINTDRLKNKIIEINNELKEKYKELDYVPKVVAFVNENPHNPIGNVLSKKEINVIKKINEICFELGVFIIDDLVYQGTEYDVNNKALPCAVFPKYFSNIITLYGASKTFNIPGIRVGFILANEKIIYEIRNQIFYEMDSYSLLNEVVLGSIFNKNTYKSEEQKKQLSYNIDLYKKNYQIIKEFVSLKDNLIKFIPGIEPKSGFFAILDFSAYKNKKYKKYTIKSEKDLLCFLYEYGGIRFVTGESMAWPNKKQLIGRITYSQDTALLKKILKILSDTLSLLR